MRIFYTGSDIEDLAASGVRQLEVGPGVALTDAARERAEELGIALVTPGSAPASKAVHGHHQPAAGGNPGGGSHPDGSGACGGWAGCGAALLGRAEGRARNTNTLAVVRSLCRHLEG